MIKHGKHFSWKIQTQNVVEKLFPDPFLKYRGWAYRWISRSFMQFVPVVCQVEGYRNMLKLSCRSLAFTSYKASLKNKKCLELVFLPRFLYECRRKIFLLLYSINWPNFNIWLSLLCEMFENMCIAIVFLPGCDQVVS